ncbi:CD225/dispanin family protein [Corynebacterium sp. H130]|uniref:CD225/dispanin family protein n=1 Tax=Corynebacterium sp. H130 TaxID=3133444 RepID=UPI0030949ADF
MYQQHNYLPPQPNSWLIPNILLTILCCNFFGIIGILFSAFSRSSWTRGDIHGARNWARWAALTFWFLLIATIIFIAATIKVEDGAVSWGFDVGTTKEFEF